MFLLVACVAGCPHTGSTTPSADVAPSLRYEVTIFDNLGGARVRVCAEGFALQELVPMYRSAARGLTRAWTRSGDLEVRAGRIDIPPERSGECSFYETRFSAEMFGEHDGSTVVVSQSQWLWRPRPLPPNAAVRASITLPAGARASTPFERDGSDLVIQRDAFYIDGYNVFGTFPELRFEVGEAVVTAALLGPSPDEASTERWLTTAIVAAGSVGDALPALRLHFVITPVAGSDRPVPFGMVRRGGGPSVLLLPSSTAPVEELEGDWVAIHELSHLWLPRLRDEDRWLSEGIATYLQEVLRARCGLQSADEAWARIHAGMSRGRRSGTNRTLSRESREMGRTGAYHRVYWSGTAFALEADIKLRQMSDGSMSLLDALALARQKRGDIRRSMAADDLLAEIDEAAGSDFLVGLGQHYATISVFPDTPMLDAEDLAQLRGEIMEVDSRCVAGGASSR